MGSADLMPRNLDHRVEVVTPIEDLALQAELASTFEALWRDTAASFELDAGGRWERVQAEEGRTPALRPADADAARAAAVLARPRSLNRFNTVSGPSQDRHLNVYPSSDRGPTMGGDESRSHRRRFEHDAAARGERGAGRPRSARDAEAAAVARRGDRAVRRRLGRPRRGRREGGPRHGGRGQTPARRLARRLPHGSRPPGDQLRRARRGTVARGGRPGAGAHEGGGGHARLSRRGPHRERRAAVTHRRLRHRRRLDRDRRRQPGPRPRLDRVRRSRVGAAHDSRGGHARRGRSRVRSPRSARGRSSPRRRRERPRGAPARRRGARRDGAGRGAADRRDDVAARGLPALRRRSRAGRDPPGRGRSCSPRCSGDSVSRCTSAAAASARVPSSRRSTRSLR